MISVCLATYNGEKYILQQVNSILNQLESCDELIISDDGSTDNTISLINSLNDNRIKLLKNENKYIKNDFIFYKVTKNFETALSNAKGELIFLSDQDDVWHNDKVSVVKNKIGNNCVLVHDCTLINDNNEIIHNSYFDLISRKSGFLNNIIKSSYLGCCMAVKSDFLNTVLPFPNVPVPHDIWIGLLAEFNKKSIFINDKLTYYRRHGKNLSASAEVSNFSTKFKIQYRLYLLIALIKRLITVK